MLTKPSFGIEAELTTVLALLANKSAAHAGRLLEHEFKKWIRQQPLDCHIYLEIAYDTSAGYVARDQWGDQGHHRVESGICLPRNQMQAVIGAFAKEWTSHLDRFPQLQDEDWTYLSIQVCPSH
jgi:hypothetical protein